MYSPEMQGLNAMSISDITGIPRATVIRKLKILVTEKFLIINKKKHYKLTGFSAARARPIQNEIFIKLSDFSAKIFNLSKL